MVQAALLSVGMTVVLLFIDPVLALVAIATAPADWRHRAASTAAACARRRGVQRAHEGEIASVANEALSAMAVVKAFGSEGYESDARARGAASSGWRRASRSRGCRRASTGSSASLRAVGTALVLVLGVVPRRRRARSARAT